MNSKIRNINGNNEEAGLEDEINDIRMERGKKDIDKVTEGWVKDWMEKGQKNTDTDDRSRERKEYILNSLAETDSEMNFRTLPAKSAGKSLFLRFALPAAAAITGALILIKTLLPSWNPDKLYAKFYEPLNAVSPVTRSAEVGLSGSYASAVENYINHNYQAAALGFLEVIQQDDQNVPSRFFMGISQMELGNYDQAVKMLEDVVSRQGDYLKEARWYLGLAYIKTGSKEKAAGCFEILAGTPGYYNLRAREILHRLR